jgi:hypothetical protein
MKGKTHDLLKDSKSHEKKESKRIERIEKAKDKKK